MAVTTTEPTDVRAAPGPLTRLANFVLHHRRWVMLAWLVIFLAGVVGATKVSNRLSVDFSLPGQPGYVTAQQIDKEYGVDSYNGVSSILVATAPSGQQVAGHAAAVDAAFRAAAAAYPGARLVDYANTHDPSFIGKDGRTTVGLLITRPADVVLDPAARRGHERRAAAEADRLDRPASPGWSSCCRATAPRVRASSSRP